ncbi:MAG: LamG domain-containing protein [Candidatus Limnocylindrus sp.]
MPTFPAIAPNSRTFTPGQYPHAVFTALSGEQSRVRHSDAVVGGIIDLTFTRLTEQERQAIEQHYLGQQGEFLAFNVPPETFSGFDPYNFLEGAGLWRYAEPPEIEDFCGPHHDVRVRLVAATGGAMGASLGPITLSMVSGAATGASLPGLAFTISVTLQPGIVTTTTAGGEVSVYLPGMEGTITTTLTAGAAEEISLSELTKLILHFDETAGSAVFENDALSNTITAEVYGSAQIDNDYAKWGIGSAQFSWPVATFGYTGHSIAFDDPSLAPGTGDFTIECWIYIVSTAPILDGTLLALPTSSIGEGRLLTTYVNSTTNYLNWGKNGSSSLTQSTPFSLNEWVHVWCVRESGVVSHAINGTLSTTTVADTTNYSYNPLYLGRKTVIGNYSTGDTYGFGGRIDDLRFTVGVARPLQVPTGPYPNI